MTDIQIERLVEDIQNALSKGELALKNDDLGYPYVAGYYGNILKTLMFMLKQEL